MGEQVPGTPPMLNPPEDRLDSWKEIAAYLNRDVTTVQRWEKREGMPVHRHLHGRMGSVYASRAELDTWAQGRRAEPAGEEAGNTPETDSAASLEPAPQARWKWLLPLAILGAACAVGVAAWLQTTDRLWRDPLANARFQTLTDFEGVEQAAAVSRDGQFVAFLADRDGPMDVWVTQVGSGLFHNLTRGRMLEIVNPSVRTLGFSPDGSLVTFWVRLRDGSSGGRISVWAVPTLGGQPRPYLQDAAEFDWSPDGSRLAYHTAASGDPLFISEDGAHSEGKRIFSAPGGLHSHFPLWSPDAALLYFVQGSLPAKLDIWRIPSGGGIPQQITSHDARVSHPLLLDRRTLLYLASDPDGSGPWLFGMDVERRSPHRLSPGLDPYTSLASSADGRRLVLTRAIPKRTLWRLRVADSSVDISAAAPISLTTSTGFSPRLGPDYLLYLSSNGTSESVWKLADGMTTELWRGQGAKIVGGPAIARGGARIAFSVLQGGKTPLYVMEADGTNARVLTDSLRLLGAPAWAPDGQSITTAADDEGVPSLLRVPVDGRPPVRFVAEYSVDPAWAPDGRFVVYSGPDIGTTFAAKAVTAEGVAHSLPAMQLTRGARRLVFLPSGMSLVFLRGEIEHKDLWLKDLETGVEQPWIRLPVDFNIRDFDVTPDGQEVVIERVQEHSDLVLMELPPRP